MFFKEYLIIIIGKTRSETKNKIWIFILQNQGFCDYVQLNFLEHIEIFDRTFLDVIKSAPNTIVYREFGRLG